MPEIINWVSIGPLVLLYFIDSSIWRYVDCVLILLSDYDEKAEDAVDYEDIDEQYEGPEIQAAGEEDYLLPKKDYLSTEVSLATLKTTTSVFDDEDYDEEIEQENEVVDTAADVEPIVLAGMLLFSSHIYFPKTSYHIYAITSNYLSHVNLFIY